MTKSNLDEDVVIETAEQAEAYWSQMSAYDKLDFYDTWETLDKENDPEDLSFYDEDTDDFNITLDDVPACENPLTHDYSATGTNDETGVLMLHNYYTNNRGTAQKYTSSSTVTIAAGTSAKVSLWVKTSDLTYADSNNNAQTVNGNRGAYIGITHTVGGNTLDQWQVKNIDTEALNPDGDNNGWVQYTFYLKGSSYANSTFTMVLGLGQADGTRFEFVNGYAFFDDVECTFISNDTFDTDTTGITTLTLDDKGESKQLLADTDAKDERTFALDLYAGFNDYDVTGQVDIALTEETKNGVTYVTADDGNLSGNGTASGDRVIYGPLGNGFDLSKDTVGVYTLAQLQAEASAKTGSPLGNILTKDFAQHESLFGTNNPIMMMLSVDGANYTATVEDSSKFVLGAGEKMAISFFLKTSKLQGTDKVTLYAVDDKGNETKLSSIDASSVNPIDIDENNKDIFDGWQQCFFFLTNDTEETTPLTFSLKVTLGSTTVVGTTKSSFHSGYAALTGFQILEDMSKTQFACISTGTYAAHAILQGEAEPTSNDSFDTVSNLPLDAIENGIAIPSTYKGVNGGSGYVNGTSTDLSYNTNAYAGLINKNYIDNYLSYVSDTDYWATKLGLTDEDKMNAFFDGATQPLLIYNDVAQSYGFIGAKQTLAADGTAPTVVSLRVKVSSGAKATVLLADMDDYSHESLLAIGRRLTYWYDDNGNVCVSDPQDADFNSRTDIAFKLQENGLYKATATGEALGADKNAYYFNLAGYEKDDEQNLLVKEGGVSYDYNDDWKNDGNDGIAFYYKDGNYYADSNKTVLVKDFATTSLAPRYTAADNQTMSITVTGDGTWQTVSFFLYPGSEEKNFRLEIWSGSRDGQTTNPAGSYVLIGANSITTSDKAAFTGRIDEYIEEICDDNDWTLEQFKTEYADVLYATYSFYDSDSFLRYDASLDKNAVGNSYDDYKSSAYEEGVAYFKYNGAVFADYSLSEQTPAVDTEASNDDTTTDDETDETSGTDVWLLVSSLIIAVVLLIAVAALIIRKATAKMHKKKAQAAAAKARSVKNRRYSSKKDNDK